MNAVENSIETKDTIDTSKAKWVYYLYLAGLVLGITGVVGVVMAYLERKDESTPDWLKTHYTYQIKTFWIGAIFMVVGGLLALVVIGYFVLLVWVVWLIIRALKGMKALDKKEPIS